MKAWITLFSQTGSEIKSIAEELGRWPDFVFTTNRNTNMWDKNIPREKVSILSPVSINEFLSNYNEVCIITLHGYLRILPANVCEKHEIYNGHPALINMYPELKGKDPQERTWEATVNSNKYPMIGSVVHHCTAELDAGKIVSSVNFINRCDSKEEVYNKLKEASFYSWVQFLRGKV